MQKEHLIKYKSVHNKNFQQTEYRGNIPQHNECCIS